MHKSLISSLAELSDRAEASVAYLREYDLVIVLDDFFYPTDKGPRATGCYQFRGWLYPSMLNDQFLRDNGIPSVLPEEGRPIDIEVPPGSQFVICHYSK